MPNYRELLQQVKSEIDEVDVTQARELLDAPERRAEMGASGRRYIEQHHSRAAIAARLEELLVEVTARRNGSA